MKKVMFAVVLALIVLSLVAGVYAAETVVRQQGQDLNEADSDVQIESSEGYQIIDLVGRRLFGIKEDEKTDLSSFVIMFVLFLVVLVMVVSAVKLLPFSSSNLRAYIIALIITLLGSLTGGIKEGAWFFLGLKDLFGTSNVLFKLWTAIIVILFLITGYFVSNLLGKLKRSIKIEEAENLGNRLATSPVVQKLKEKGIMKQLFC